METDDVTPAEMMKNLTDQVDADLCQSWVVQDPSRLTRVRLRFHMRMDGQIENFIRNRVMREACWGEIGEDKGGTFLFEIDVNGFWEIKPWIRSFGSSVEVLAPKELRQEIAAEWREIGGIYESI